MYPDSLCVKYLEAFSFAHVSDGFQDEDGWDKLNSFMTLEGSPLAQVKNLKERGNSLFKQKNFDVAAACYDKACKLLGFALGGLDAYDVKNVCELAVSLNLNLAASAIKLLEYEASKDLCSLVLSTFPHNVKALFRRAMGFMGLKMFTEAKTDLERAILIEPKNKEILRELTVVNNYLEINCNGKRRLQAGVEEKNTNNLGTNCNKKNLVEHSECSSSISSSGPKIGGKDNPLNEGYSVCPDMEVEPEADIQQVSGKMFNFDKKGEGRSNLRISANTYQKLFDGNEVSFYQKHHLTSMTIRLLRPSHVDVETQSNFPQKKKRKRRRKKRKTKAKDTHTTNDVLAPLTLSNNETCDTETTHRKAITDVSAESVEILMVEDNTVVVEDDVPQILATHFPPMNSAVAPRRTFKRLSSPVARLYLHHSGDADPPDVSRPKNLASSAMTRLRVRCFRHLRGSIVHENKNSHSFNRFPSDRKTNFIFPRPRGVSLYYSNNILSNTKRKSVDIPDFMQLFLSPPKKRCRNHYPSGSFSIGSTIMLNNSVCN